MAGVIPQKGSFMSTPEQDFDVFMSNALVALAEINPDIDAVLQTSASSWSLGFQGDEQIDLELFETGQRLMLSTTLANVGQDALEKAMQGLLTYNLMWRETGNVRTALAESHIFLITDLPVAVLDSDSLSLALANLRRARSQWDRFFQQAPADAVDFSAEHILRA